MNNLNKEIKIKPNFMGCYTLLWLAMSLCVYFLLILDNRTTIWVVDGMSQHLTALTYYSEWLRDIIKNIFSGNFHIREWDMAIGEGSDVFNTFNYYCIGDPFAILSILFPKQYMYVCYVILTLMRSYLAGITFDMLLKKIKPDVKLAARTVAAITYAFSFWEIYNAVRHPFFINPLVFMPLVILGIEKIIRKEKPYVFIAAVALIGISNVYFFYIMVLLTSLYVAVRLIDVYGKDIKAVGKTLGQIFLFALMGVLISGAFLFPSIMNLMEDSRLADGSGIKLFYPLSYYSKFLDSLTYTGEYYLCLGFTIPAFIAIGLIWKNKGHRSLKVFSILILLFSLIPAFGQMFNGFSYITNRWSFVAPLVVAIILGLMWDNLMNLSKKEMIVSLASIVLYMILNVVLKLIIGEEPYAQVIVTASLGIVFVIYVYLKKNAKVILASILILISVAYTGLCYTSGIGESSNNHATAFTYFPDLYYNHTEAAAIKEHSQSETFGRYTGWVLTDNVGVYNGISSTQYYWSNNNPYIMKFRTDVGIDEYRLFYYSGYDSDSALNALASVDTYAQQDDVQPVPYGFERAYEANDYVFYNNKNALPIAYTYDKTLSVEKWNELNLVERRQALLEAAVIEEGGNNINLDNVSSAELEITKLSNVTMGSEALTVDPNDGTITLEFEGKDNAEYFLVVNNLDYSSEGEEPEYITFAALNEEQILKYFIFFNENLNWYNGRRDFAINLGYFENKMNKFQIYVPKNGTYTFDDIKLIMVDKSVFAEKIEKLKQDDISNIVISEDKVAMDATLSADKFMVFSIPYSKGWSLKVDGVETKLINANGQYMGAYMGAGTHQIELVYNNNNLKTGWIISGVGILLFGIVILGYNKFTNRIKNAK